jgi:hypothetical protein
MHKGELHLVIPALRTAIAALTSLPSQASPSASQRCSLWSFAVVEAFSTPTYSVISQYASVPLSSDPNSAAIQVYTLGESAAATMGQLALIHTALLDVLAAGGSGADADYEPRRDWLVGEEPNRWLLDIFELEEGAIIGSDDRGRIDGSFNFLLAYRRVPVA